MENTNKLHYLRDPDYIKYNESFESTAVFIVRDVCTSVDTSGYWIDIITAPNTPKQDKFGNILWDFQFIIFDLFPRTMKPDYTHSRSDEEDKYITWYTARNDIDKQKNKGVVGIRYCIEPILYDKNKGKTRKKTVFWNKTFNRAVPEKWKNSSCEYRTIDVPLTPNWKYSIKSVKKQSIADEKQFLVKKYHLVHENNAWYSDRENSHKHLIFKDSFFERSDVIGLLFRINKLCMAKVKYFRANINKFEPLKYNYKNGFIRVQLWDSDFLRHRASGFILDYRYLQTITVYEDFVSLCNELEAFETQ